MHCSYERDCTAPTRVREVSGTQTILQWNQDLSDQVRSLFKRNALSEAELENIKNDMRRRSTRGIVSTIPPQHEEPRNN